MNLTEYTKGGTSYVREAVADASARVVFEIGDSKQPDFYPQFKSCHWVDGNGANECNLSVRLTDQDYAAGAVEEKTGALEWKRGDRIARFYEKPEGFEFEVELLSAPASNVLDFTIQSKEFDFFLQPELTPEEIAAGDIRPENVVGSYAVYHKTRRHNVEGGKSYATGKALHIFRPDATDANGKTAWCELAIDGDAGTMQITVPQKFLDEAVYPVVIDPTFGYTTQGVSSTSIEGQTIAGKAASTEVGTLTTLTAWLTNTTSGKLTRAALYAYVSDTDGGAFLHQSSALNVPADGVAAAYNFACAAYALAATNYFLAVLSETGSGNNVCHFDTGGKGLVRVATYPTWPDPFVEDATNTRLVSIYATYTTSLNPQKLSPGMRGRLGNLTAGGFQ